MSRVGRRIITIPEKVTVVMNSDQSEVTVKGPLGTLVKFVPNTIKVIQKDNQITTTPTTLAPKALWGTVNSLLNNYLIGVTKGFTKNLIVQGLGYKAIVKGDHLELALGFSHLVKFPIPQGIKITVTKNTKISIFGLDKELVGLTASRIRKLKKPEPYKGKGIRYETEQLTLKVGKTGSTKK